MRIPVVETVGVIGRGRVDRQTSEQSAVAAGGTPQIAGDIRRRHEQPGQRGPVHQPQVITSPPRL